MIKVYVCSPLSGDIAENIKKARAYSLYVTTTGKLPITPHIYFTQFLNDENEDERKLGISLGLELLDMCDMLWVFGDKVSNGMKLELDYWKNTKGDVGITYFKEFNFKKGIPR